MKKFCCLVLALLLLVITPVSAEVVTSEHIGYERHVDESFTLPYDGGYSWDRNPGLEITFSGDIQHFQDIELLYLGDLSPACILNPAVNTSGSTPFTVSNGEIEGEIHYNVHFLNGQPSKVQVWLTFDHFAPTGTGTVRYVLIYDKDAVSYVNIKGQAKTAFWPTTPFICFSASEAATGYRPFIGTYIYRYTEKFEHDYVLTEYDSEYVLDVFRHGYKSTIELKDAVYDYIQIPDVGNDDFRRKIPKLTLEPPIYLNITAVHGDYFYRELLTETPTPPPDEPDTPAVTADVTVYVKNSQTGALIADANIVIDALVNGEYYPVVNRSEPSGIFSINLQPTGGGKPNPDGYRLIVTADGYNNPMPEINFTVDDYKLSMYCLLDPIAGGPVNENKTFIDFFVRDMKSNPISGATVKFGKYTLITNSQGYTVFEVDKNNNYSWTISKSGYGPLTGNAVIGDAPRHTINTVLAPIVTPTTTTPIPTSPPIGPTPTMTAPTGEHVSNWLEWFAAHFGMILGGGVEIGKIFMWLCFTVPVGVYVGKEAKAGAAGFMAGAGIVTLFFVLIGWVPIWLVVLLALIIGLLYAKMFNTPDNGGGR
jgi:hypothetical protein